MTQPVPFILTIFAVGMAARTSTAESARALPLMAPAMDVARIQDAPPTDGILACTSDDQCPDFMPYCLEGSCAPYAVSCTYDPVLCSVGHHGGLCVCGDGSTVAWGEDPTNDPSPSELMTQCELSAQHYCASAFPHEACEADGDCSVALPYCEDGRCQPNLSCVNPAGTCVATRFGGSCDCITRVVVVTNDQTDTTFPPRSDLQAACLTDLESECGTELPPLPISCVDDALAICTAYADHKIEFDRACTGEAGNNQPFANLYECCVNEYWADEFDRAAVDCITDLDATTCSEWLHGWWSCTAGDDTVTDEASTDASSDSQSDDASGEDVTDSNTTLTTTATNDETTDEASGTHSTGADTEDDHEDGSHDDLEEWLVSCEAHGGDEHGCAFGRTSTPWIAALAAFVWGRRRRSRP